MTTTPPPNLGRYSPVATKTRPSTWLGYDVSVSFVLVGWPTGDPAASFPLCSVDDEIQPRVSSINLASLELKDTGSGTVLEITAATVSRDGLVIDFVADSLESVNYFLAVSPDESWPKLENGTYQPSPASFKFETDDLRLDATYTASKSRPRQEIFDIGPGQKGYRLSWALRSKSPGKRGWKTNTSEVPEEVPGEYMIVTPKGDLLAVAPSASIQSSRITIEFEADFVIPKGLLVRVITLPDTTCPPQDAGMSYWVNPDFLPVTWNLEIQPTP